MRESLLLPSLGEGIEAGSVIRVAVAPGEAVVTGQPLFEVEADKVTVEIPATADGSVLELLVAPGDQVPVGGRLATLEVAEVSAPAGVVREQPAEREGAVPRESAHPHSGGSGQPASAGHPAPAGPAARRMARQLGVDIRTVAGSGQRGRIGRQDVILHAANLLRGGGIGGERPAADSRLPDLTRFGLTERVPLTSIERATARNMSRVWREIPHAWLQQQVDITHLEQLRARLRDDSGNALPLSITPFLVRATALTMQAFPLFNASIDLADQVLVYRRYIDIGVAVDTDRGLMVPVLRQADGKCLQAIAEELAELAGRARDNGLRADELQGAGMTLSNLGGMGVGTIFPLINWPQSSILGVASARWSNRPTDSGEWRERLLLPLTLAIDHRLINGAQGARFLAYLKGLLEDPDSLAPI